MPIRSATACVALPLLLMLAAAPAAASELDGLVFLSWSAEAIVDTLEAGAAGDVDCWVVVRNDLAPARFVEAAGSWSFGDGLVPKDLEVLTTGLPVGAIIPGERGLIEVRIADFDCRRDNTVTAVARLTIAVDPQAFAGGAAVIEPLVVPASEAVRLSFADYDPVMHCVGQADLARIAPVVVIDPATADRSSSFGGVKASYR